MLRLFKKWKAAAEARDAKACDVIHKNEWRQWKDYLLVVFSKSHMDEEFEALSKIGYMDFDLMEKYIAQFKESFMTCRIQYLLSFIRDCQPIAGSPPIIY